ncbi:hypothetical protein GCM10011371_25410 [Novosphingobium marinum]|uniref:Putative Zn finger-like uncharacterized protein n=1 Tax=Novosphingobium marinum TaxID=1514948 RepID=A0A7Y9XUH5_9SPHN|nr:zinc-ribbon domain-containing protein [Novosphingobium marinum]NYH94844.1 putative Zn finger-like uncharacterized protein [Novosphingobium marinum]GGC36939.1 hypothetical protein GCM10011371_25410 [Novosphingobium marinum]
MIIACPACSTRYVVPDSAIGAEGRTVRCAKCRHSWFQEGPDLADPVASQDPFEEAGVPAPTAAPVPLPPEPEPEPEPAEPAPEAEPVAEEESGEKPFGEARHGHAAEEEVTPQVGDAEQGPAPRPQTAFQPAQPAAVPEMASPTPDAALHWRQSPIGPREEPEPPLAEIGDRGDNAGARYDDDTEGRYFDEAPSSFEFEPPFRPRRNRAKILMIGAILFALVALGAAAAVSYYGLPDWVPVKRATFAEAQPDLVLEFPPNRQERRTLPNGTEFFGASGTITNVGQSRRTVPAILIVLRDARERIVYSWEVAPPQRQLAPGESVTVNEAVTDVPKSATAAEIGWKPG